MFLFSFTKKRNENRIIDKMEISFTDDNEPFITRETVNKLLIQSNGALTNVAKEKVVLKEMESRLLKNPMIKNAEVFLSIDGVLGAKITQRNPVGRVASQTNFYIDDEGKKMPLSNVYSARTPLITGNAEPYFKELTTLLLAIEKDPFMQSSVVGLSVERNGNVVLRLRKHDFLVRFGKPESIARKFQNFKAFYKKAKADNLLESYATVDLQFGKQVVATKK